MYRAGTGGLLADTLTLEMLIWDATHGSWTRFEQKVLKMQEVGEFKVHHSERCFARIAAEGTTATDLRIRVAAGRDGRMR